MAEQRDEGGGLAVFISYSRDDIGFADQLDAALRLHKYNVSIDRQGISGGEDWKSRLAILIRSACSEICRWEVEEAARLAKRIIPVVCRPLEAPLRPLNRARGPTSAFMPRRATKSRREGYRSICPPLAVLFSY